MSGADSKDFSPEGERPLHRRGFFGEGLRSFLRPIADLLEERLQDVNAALWVDEGAFGEADGARGGSTPIAPSPPAPQLRPPGALPEAEFLSRCVSSGHCVRACPVSAIRLVWCADPRSNGKPAIEPASQACVICEDLKCTKVCPSGAIRPVARGEIRMGLAEVSRERCLRSAGEDCRICVDKCPVGERAIRLSPEGSGVEVRPEACAGCGLCEMVCPARPRAIAVRPREA